MHLGLSKEETFDLIRATKNPLFEIEEVKEGRRTRVVDGFMIGRYEVTNQEYKAVMPTYTFPFGDEQRPVHNLPKEQMEEFLKKLTEQYPALSIGLPEEVEWEYAARGYEHYKPYAWDTEGAAVFDPTKANVGTKRLDYAGQKAEGASWCGAEDMIGNVEEVSIVNAENYSANLDQKLVARGGSFGSDTVDSRTTSRHLLWTPKANEIGFRIAIRLKGEK